VASAAVIALLVQAALWGDTLVKSYLVRGVKR
jgi:hypothetical protein